ncbi:hypothetical protein PV326_008519 [Microctonus aethiopoides]|nr:hypothetical protein PV326_008519 [Microctonus aethiopoides]
MFIFQCRLLGNIACGKWNPSVTAVCSRLMANSVALKFSWQGCSNKKRCFSQLMLAKLLCKTLKKIGSEKWTEKEIEEGISKWLIRAPTRRISSVDDSENDLEEDCELPLKTIDELKEFEKRLKREEYRTKVELWDLDLTRLGQRAALRYSLMSNRFVVKNKKVTAENCYKAADFGVSLRVHSRWALNALSALKCHFQHWTGMNNERSKRVSAQRECTLSDEFRTIFILISELIESQIQKP